MATDARTDSARAAVLGRVADALGRRDRAARAADAEARLRTPAIAARPERASRSGTARIAQFVEMVELSGATLARLPGMADVPRAVAEYAHLHANTRAVLADDAGLAQLDWPASRLTIEQRRVRSGDPLFVTRAPLAVAETGTLVFASSANAAAADLFLSERIVAVVAADAVVAGYEDAWAWVRGLPAPPRALNWVTGPSRSADIELRMAFGAHGPLAVHVLLLGAV